MTGTLSNILMSHSLFNPIRYCRSDLPIHRRESNAPLVRGMFILAYLEHLHQLHGEVQVACQLDLALHEGLHTV